MKRLLLVFFLCGADVKADGLFLDLDIGVITNSDYKVTRDNPLDKIAPESPIGLIRIGYEYEMAHIYFEHASSISNRYDPGVNLIMIGIRIDATTSRGIQ